MGMLKKGASFVLGPLSCSRTPVYATPAKDPAALLDLASPSLLRRSSFGYEGRERLRTGERTFLNIPNYDLLSFRGLGEKVLNFP